MRKYVNERFAWDVYKYWDDEETQEIVEALVAEIKKENREWARKHSYGSDEERQYREDLLDSLHDRGFWFKFALLSDWEFDF